jgi:hypothetical protein
MDKYIKFDTSDNLMQEKKHMLHVFVQQCESFGDECLQRQGLVRSAQWAYAKAIETLSHNRYLMQGIDTNVDQWMTRIYSRKAGALWLEDNNQGTREFSFSLLLIIRSKLTCILCIVHAAAA